MNYELAKQLKDAGFKGIGLCEGGKNCRYMESKSHVDFSPTLSELIKACGSKFAVLSKDPNELLWYSCGTTEISGSVLKVYGSTPEEAVAKLWLELNKK